VAKKPKAKVGRTARRTAKPAVAKRSASKKPVQKKPAHRSASASSRGNAPTGEIARLRAELRAVREWQQATADILRTIAAAPSDAGRALNAIAETAARLFGAAGATIRTLHGGRLRVVGSAGPAGERLRSALGEEFPLSAATLPGATIAGKRQIQVPDIENPDPDMADWPGWVPQRAAGMRTVVGTPLIREGAAIGAMMVQRAEVKPFTEGELAQLANFADQAVIAIENARLLSELRESLETQTASADILRAIAASSADLPHVMKVIADNAARLCEANDVNIYRLMGDRLCMTFSLGNVGSLGPKELPIDRQSATGRAFLERRMVDVGNFAESLGEFSRIELDHARAVPSVLAVPMLRDGEAIGVIVVVRGQVRPFTDRHKTLMAAFADQAVIAIENARLLDELESWNKTLEERVSQQVSELDRMGQLRRFLSPQIAELVSSGSAALLESHRREITVVYCDMRGFTAFAESAEPEEVMGVLAEYHAALGELIHEYEGTLERFVGDGVLVLFNDPVPCPDPAARAVRMAVAMRDRFAVLSRGWSTRGHALGFGVGIAQGYATLGRIGFEGRFDYGSVGTVSNVGARLCAEAQDGQILVTRQVQTAVEDIAACEPVGELVLKGLRRPVAAYNVAGLKTAEALPR
jgi:class 3 adenylate cyclase